MKITTDIVTKEWFIDENPSTNTYINFYMGFLENNSVPVFFENLSFGYSLISEDIEISKDSRPRDDVTYVSTDQEYVDNFIINDLMPGKEYQLDIWVKNAEEEWDQSFIFTLPKPEQPFPSWIYDENLNTWKPPVLYPNDNKYYAWNEELQNWVEIE